MSQQSGPSVPPGDRGAQATRPNGAARTVLLALFFAGIVAGLACATVFFVWLITVQPVSLNSVESRIAGKRLMIGTVESTDTYLYATKGIPGEPGPALTCEVVGPYRAEDILRKLSPGEAPVKDFGFGVSLHPVYEFTENRPSGRAWHVLCDHSAGTTVDYSFGPKTWPPGTPTQWMEWLVISVIAVFVWGTATGIAAAVVRRR